MNKSASAEKHGKFSVPGDKQDHHSETVEDNRRREIRERKRKGLFIGMLDGLL